MTEFVLGSKVPRSGDAVLDFTIKKNGVPTEPTTVTVKWKDQAGATQETDTLANSGVYRPTGSTAQNDPGHFRAKRTVGANETLGVGYTVTVEGDISGTAFGPTTLASYEVVASEATVVQGGPTLASVTDVKDVLKDIIGLTAPAGLTDAKISGWLATIEGKVLDRYGVAAQTNLNERQKLVAKDAEIKLAVAECLLSLRAGDRETLELVDLYRKQAFEDVDDSRGTGPAKRPRRVRMRLG